MSLNPNAKNSFPRVMLADDPRPVFIQNMHTTDAHTNLAAPAAIGDMSTEVLSITGFVIGQLILIFSAETVRVYRGTIVGVLGNIVYLDTPIDSAFPIGANVDVGSKNLAVDGSVTPVEFTVRGPGPGIDISLDITRLLIQITTDSAVDFGKFGDIGALDYGLALRSETSAGFSNLFNVKTNGEIAAITYDYNSYDASNPGIGVYGIGARLTFAGQSKLGAPIRLKKGEDLRAIVQDDLLDLLTLSLVVEGHVSEIAV